MKTFKVYKHPSGEFEAVKQGWSWPGFFFGFFWALFKKLWTVALLLFLIGMLLGMVVYDPSVALVLQIIITLVVGYLGNSWRESKLESLGFKYVGTSMAQNGPTAVAKQLETD